MTTPIVELRASGRAYLARATELLQRARLAHPEEGVWEAADLQWWWRTPRSSDELDQHFWLDEHGPLAAFVLTDWSSAWGCDLLVVPGDDRVPIATVWDRALESIVRLRLPVVDALVRDDDEAIIDLVTDAGFVPEGSPSGITWMRADQRPAVVAPPPGFSLIGRSTSQRPHALKPRSGEGVEARLRQCPLYDPGLDMAMVTGDGETAAYALFWFDPMTRVGLVEPMRVEDDYRRRGLGRALLTAGLDRLARRGAHRLKVGYGGDAGRELYLSVGFRESATLTSYRRRMA